MHSVLNESSIEPNMYHVAGPSSQKTDIAQSQQTDSLNDRKESVSSKKILKSFGKLMTSIFPLVKTVYEYKLRLYLSRDIIAGLSVSFLHIPQGLGFGLLAGLSASCGLYTSLFPVLGYMVFGTSPHISFGTNALIALLVTEMGENVVNVGADGDVYNGSFSKNRGLGNSSDLDGVSKDIDILETKMRTAALASLLCGITLLTLGVLRLGFVTTYLAPPFISGFTTSAAIHIIFSQIANMLGLTLPTVSNPFRLVKTLIEIGKRFKEANPYETILFTACLILLVIFDRLNSYLKSRAKIPFPSDIIIVVLGTVVSFFVDLCSVADIRIVGEIRVSLPSPSVPSFRNVHLIAGEAMITAVLVFVLSISLAQLTAAKHKLQIDANKELRAYGLSNMLSSFFNCFPACTAPPRHMMLSSLNSQTTLNGVFTSIFLLLTILVIGQYLEALPLSILAAVIIMAVKDLLLQIKDSRTYWKVNRYDFYIWSLTCSFSVFISLEVGLMVGVFASVMSVICQQQQLASHWQEQDTKWQVEYDIGIEGQNIRVVRFASSLHFATVAVFKKRIFKVIDDFKKVSKNLKHRTVREVVVNPGNTSLTSSFPNRNEIDCKDCLSGDSPQIQRISLVEAESSMETQSTIREIDVQRGLQPPVANQEEKISEINIQDDINLLNIPTTTNCIILECSRVGYIDMAGVKTLKQIVNECRDEDIEIFFSGFINIVLNTLCAADFFKEFDRNKVFSKVEVAIATIKNRHFINTDVDI